MDARRERFLEDLQQWLDAVPLRTTHVHNDCEAMSSHLLTAENDKIKIKSKLPHEYEINKNKYKKRVIRGKKIKQDSELTGNKKVSELYKPIQ